MATHNSYVAYKRDTRNLVYWMIHASNAVIKSLPAMKDECSVALNTSGQTTVAGLEAMAELIGRHIRPVPDAIFHLFRSVIDARSAHYAEFQQLTAAKPDADVEKSNATHKFFIDALARAFKALGGDDWVSSQDKPSKLHASEIEDVVFSNRFAVLNLGADDRLDPSGESSDDEAEASGAPHRRAQRKPSKGKGKKGKGGKKLKPKQKQKKPVTQQNELDGVPIESYRIIESEEGIVTEYLMAAYSVTGEWNDLRAHLRDVWHEVAYHGLNSAAAGTLSNLAIGMVKQTESEIFVDFPGHESYETLFQTITRGDVDKAQGMFTVSFKIPIRDNVYHTVQESELDIKEHFLFNAYTDLVDFVTDYQKNRTGKPTKAMQAEINDWDPNFDPQRATREQRLKWRRSYTLNWLYDLVNIFSSVVVQRIRIHGENHVLEDVDWSPGGPWSDKRTVFGITDFAAFATTLAMQKPGTNVRKKILPHHVFQLQVIVDAFTVSRGWSYDTLRGHLLTAPPKNFRPRRDVDKFMGRGRKRKSTGFPESVNNLKQHLDQATDGPSGTFSQSYAVCDTLEGFKFNFQHWLGLTKYRNGFDKIPPSRFSNSNANGLWEYSPFLCGVGLMEALELAYIGAMFVWEHYPAPTVLFHLHNILVQKGYITSPVGLIKDLEAFFGDAFFASGKPPTSNFATALTGVVSKAVKRGTKPRSQPSAHQEKGFHALMDISINRRFNKKSKLMLYREAGWRVDRIPDSAVDPLSMLGMIRISQTKHTIDPKTGKRRYEDTDLVRRLREYGEDEDMHIRSTSKAVRMMQKDKQEAARQQDFLQSTDPGNKVFSKSELAGQVGGDVGHGIQVSGRDLLELLRSDVLDDVCGNLQPLSALNYVAVANWVLLLFREFRDELKRQGTQRHLRALDAASIDMDKNFKIAQLALVEQDEECLRILAGVFEKRRQELTDFIYWDKLMLTTEEPGSGPGGSLEIDVCTIM